MQKIQTIKKIKKKIKIHIIQKSTKFQKYTIQKKKIQQFNS